MSIQIIGHHGHNQGHGHNQPEVVGFKNNILFYLKEFN